MTFGHVSHYLFGQYRCLIIGPLGTVVAVLGPFDDKQEADAAGVEYIREVLNHG